MKSLFTILALSIVSLISYGQEEVVVEFENFGLAPTEFLNGSDGTTEFETDFFKLGISYFEPYMSWSGWAIVAGTDTTTQGFTNQYSSITGSGVNGSTSYAMSFNSSPNPLDMLELTDAIAQPLGVYVNNSAYAYLSMSNGDDFAKKFGGLSGTDPDYFLLTIRGENQEGLQDSVEFYLADFRSDDSAEDYIIKEWTYIDLSKFAYHKDLTFGLTTTDIGVYGPNTPAYFCIDNFVFDLTTTDTEDESFSDLKVYPNPASDYLNIDFETSGTYSISTISGQLITDNQTLTSSVNVNPLENGVYNLQIKTDKGVANRRFVKI